MIELKQKSKEKEDEIELYKNKILFSDCKNELDNHILKNRKRPSQIKYKNKYGLLYNYIYRFFI
jgi:hypothetical protein